MSAYYMTIKRLAPDHDPRHIEAFMRLEYPCLDGLNARQFDEQVGIAILCIKDGGLEFAEKIAKSFGL